MTPHIDTGSVVHIMPGDYFTMILPDGTALNVEQTADDFSIVRETGNVAYTKATSPTAKHIDNESEALESETTGKN